MATAVTAVRGLIRGQGWPVYAELPPGDARPPMVFVRAAGAEVLDRGMGDSWSLTRHEVEVEVLAKSAEAASAMRAEALAALDGAQVGRFRAWFEIGGGVETDPDTQTVAAVDVYRVIEERASGGI